MDYKTIAQEAQAEYIVKHSRFIGHIKPVTSAEQAIEFIAQVKTKHWDASHNVSAYVLRAGNIQRYSDDGEPQGTAGVPTLDVLLKEGLTDCAVVVTRYFGGVLLGAGGLVRAYSHSAKMAVDAGRIVTMSLCAVLTVNCDYNFFGKLSSMVPELGGFIEDTRFADDVTVTLRMPVTLLPIFDAKLIDCSLGRFKSEKIGEIFAETFK
ncbi:MAG: YigZ family protein [Eubacteriales bacterium]